MFVALFAIGDGADRLRRRRSPGSAGSSSASATGCGATPSRCGALPERLLRERDRIVGTLGPRWKRALAATCGRWAFDYATLLAALAAVGSQPRPGLVLLAFCAAQVLAQIPITPGGLGFVEAGLTGDARAGRRLARARRCSPRSPTGCSPTGCRSRSGLAAFGWHARRYRAVTAT